MLAKQSTALTVVVGPILDSTGAEYASAVIGDLSISKNGGTLTAMASAATLTYIANGMYTLVTTTGNMDTLGAVQVTCNKATYQMPKMERNVVPASVYDAIITNATNSTGGLPTATAAITGLAGVISTYAGGAVASVTGNVGGISGVTFPANFASLGINSSGHVSRVVLVDTTTTNTDMRGTDGAALASAWTATRAGYLDGVLLASNYNQRTVQVTGSNHVAADIHELQAGVITAGDFAANWLTAAGLAADAATKIATAVGAPSAATIADAVWDEILSGHLGTGSTGSALNNSGGSGNPWIVDIATGYSGTQAGNVLNQVKAKTDLISASPTINVYPVSASTPERVAGTTITYYRNEIRTVSVVTDFTLTSLTLSFTVEDSEGTDLLTIANALISRSGQTFTVSIGTAVTATISNYRWALRDITGGSNSVIARGVLTVQEAG